MDIKTEKPEGIIVTAPAMFLKEYGGEENFNRDFERLNLGKYIWNHTISTVPRIEVVYCYILYAGRIRYRANIVEFQGKQTKTFSDGRSVHGRAWAILSGPVVKAPEVIERKGFQGFRYTPFLF